MAKRGKKLTPMQEAYKKEQNRIKNFIRRAEKRGYHFEEGLIPEMPKRVTQKALEDIKRINQYKLYKHSEHYYEESGLHTPGRERRKFERSMSAERANITRGVNKLIRDYGYDKSEAREIYWKKVKEKRERENDAYAKSRGYSDWDELVESNRKYERERELYDTPDDSESYVEEVQEVPVTIEVPHIKPAPVFETTDEKIERLKRELAEAEQEKAKEVETKPVYSEEDISQASDFYKELMNKINENAKGSRDRYYENNKDRQKNDTNIPPERTTLVLNTIEDMISSWEPDPRWSEYWTGVKEDDKNRLDRMLQNAIENEGRTTVAERLERQAEYAISLADAICYGSGSKGNGRDDVNRAFTEFSAIIMGRNLTFEENAKWTTYSEEGGIYN